jgi:hypothetical protein
MVGLLLVFCSRTATLTHSKVHCLALLLQQDQIAVYIPLDLEFQFYLLVQVLLVFLTLLYCHMVLHIMVWV